MAYVSLKSNLNQNFMRHNVEKGEYEGFLQCSGDEKLNPMTKFSMEASDNEPGLVHIKSCYNNKYIVRNASDGDWIVVAANEKEEDKSKWSCTLFKPILLEGDDKKTTVVRFQHIQSGIFACLSNVPTAATSEDMSVTAYAGLSKISAQDSSDTYTIIYWTVTDILPQMLAFKGDNGKYIAPHPETGIVLFFGANNIEDNGVANEIVKFEDRTLIKNVTTGQFWEFLPWDYLYLNTTNPSSNPMFTFEAIRLDNVNEIALRYLYTNKLCGRSDVGRKSGYVDCGYDSINKYTRLTIEENVILRTIYDVVYDYDNARIYDVSDVDVITRTYKNHGSSPETYTLEVNYQHSRTKMWNSTVTAKLGVKTEVKAGIPFIADGKIETSLEISGKYQWGQSETETLTLKDTLPVTVPGGKQRTARCVAKKGKCDIPFTYVQTDLLYNGQSSTKTLGDGIYSGANHYDFSFEAGPEDPFPLLLMNDPSSIIKLPLRW